MKNSRVELDKRNADDIKNQIEALAKAYVPEWNFDRSNPDIGSVICLLFAEQMADNVKHFNDLVDVYHAELVNMTGVSLMQAQPAGTNVVMELVSDTVAGSYVPKGTKLFGGDAETRFIFETAHPAYITSSKLKEVISTDEETGTVRALYGTKDKMTLLPDYSEDAESSGAEEFTIEGLGEEQQITFTAFDNKTEGVGKNAVLLYHSYYFDVDDDTVYMRLKGPDDLPSKILDGQYSIKYLSEEGIVPFDSVTLVKDDILALKKSKPCKKYMSDKEYSVMIIEALKPISSNVVLENVDFSSMGSKQLFTSVNNGNTDLTVEEFKPFGDTLSLFSECYLSHDNYFSRVGAQITISFDLSFGVHNVSMSAAQIEDSLKIVKRKPRLAINTRVVEAFVDEVSVEYLSVTGWKRLKLSTDATTIFAKAEGGKYCFSFICPGDWAEDTQRSIRLQVIKCENCYMMPCKHNYPIISNARIEYSYNDRFIKPEKVETVYGMTREDVTTAFMTGRPITAFRSSIYKDNAMYLGFDRKFEAGPISLSIVFEEEIARSGIALKYEYSTAEGFRTLQIIDKTEALSRSGQIRFIPPDDMSMIDIEGRKCYYIRIIDVNKHFSDKNIYHPIIKDIILNSVEVYNIDTHDFEEFYIDEVAPNMEVSIAADNMLDADVFVNEKGLHSEVEMQSIIKKTPDDVYVEYDSFGNIKEFFVKWKEVSSFDNSKSSDRHYVLDRMSSTVYFGDGVRGAVPSVTNGTAIRIKARSCNGSEANIPAKSIEGSIGMLDFIGSITNPFPAFGGSSTESIYSAMNRAANIIGSRNRIVTIADYKNEILSFSENINKVECVVGETVDGVKKEGVISIVLLMKDFGLGTHSFDRIVPRLRSHLEECVEMTACDNVIEIVEPIGLSISVDIWMNKMKDENDYEIQMKLINDLNDFLSPVSDIYHAGWEIGKLPSRTQIMMRLNSLKTGAFIRRLVITGSYADASGVHECDLEDIVPNRFFVVKNGVHKAHIISDEKLKFV